MHRITSTRLRQIISEEVRRFIAESDGGEADVPTGKKMVQAAQGMIALKDALSKFKETSPDAAAAIEAQLADLEAILDTKLEPLESLIAPSAPSAKFAGSQGLQEPPAEEDEEPVDDDDDIDDEGGY